MSKDKDKDEATADEAERELTAQEKHDQGLELTDADLREIERGETQG